MLLCLGAGARMSTVPPCGVRQSVIASGQFSPFGWLGGWCGWSSSAPYEAIRPHCFTCLPLPSLCRSLDLPVWLSQYCLAPFRSVRQVHQSHQRISPRGRLRTPCCLRPQPLLAIRGQNIKRGHVSHTPNLARPVPDTQSQTFEEDTLSSSSIQPTTQSFRRQCPPKPSSDSQADSSSRRLESSFTMHCHY